MLRLPCILCKHWWASFGAYIDVSGWNYYYEYELPFKNLDQMKTSVAKVDTAPVKILYEGG